MASPKVAPAAPEGQSEALGYTVADLIRAYREDKVDGASPSTQRAYQPVFRFLREVAGESAALASIDRIEGRRLFNLVCKLPSGIGKQKALRGLAVPDAIAEGARRSLPTISAIGRASCRESMGQ